MNAKVKPPITDLDRAAVGHIKNHVEETLVALLNPRRTLMLAIVEKTAAPRIILAEIIALAVLFSDLDPQYADDIVCVASVYAEHWGFESTLKGAFK